MRYKKGKKSNKSKRGERSKKIKKILWSQTKSHLIPEELIKNRCFVEIVDRINENSELANRDRYIYGYSLLRTQQNLEALVNLWPLASREAAKGQVKLQEDCAIIASHVFADEDRLFSVHLSDDYIYTLFLAAKTLFPQSGICHRLKKRLFDVLWQQGHFEKLERILKSSKEEFSGVLVENLSKLDFFQPNRKLLGNIPAFVGHILTGGACLIARNSICHGDIVNEIRFFCLLLANEVKHLFYRIKANNQSLTWDKILFENFVDYEVNILTHILQIVVKNVENVKNTENTKSNREYLDIIPTPSYLIHYDAMTKRVSEKFLPWLASKNKELSEVYDADNYYAALWAIGGEKTARISKVLKSINKNNINPYLRLAVMMRSMDVKKASLEKLVQVSDFTNFKQTTNVFKNIAIQAAKHMANNQFHMELSTAFWRLLIEFCHILQDPDCSNMLITKLIEKLEKDRVGQRNLDVVILKKIAHQINAHDLVKRAEILCARQQACIKLLLSFKDKKESEKIIRNIKEETHLRTHLTLIADCCLLVYKELSGWFFQHIKSIVQNKKINKLIPLRELFCCRFDCTCMSCREMLYRDEIPNMAKELSLPIASIPDISCYAYKQSSSKTQKLKPSILTQTDPFKILGVSLDDSKPVIMQKVMRLIQQSPEQMANYRQAQNELFNPAQRLLHQYLRYLNYSDNAVENSAQQSSPESKIPLHKIPLRQDFI